jgi:hypothetical protein
MDMVDTKPWVELGNLCTSSDYDIFATATMPTVRNDKRPLFWDLAWLNGMRPKDTALLIYDLAKERNCSIV